MKEQALIKKIEVQTKIFKSREVTGHSDEKRHDLIHRDEQKWMFIAYDQLGWSFDRIGSVFGRDPRTVARKVQGEEQPSLATTRLVEAKRKRLDEKEKPYEETPHKQKMRELAKVLAGKISLPSLWDKDLWRDLPVEFQLGKYSLPIGVVEIGKDKQIKVNYYDIGAGFAAPHIVKGLYSHLSTSGLSGFAELVGDKGRLDDWVSEVGQYSEGLLRFLKLIADEVKGYRAKVNFQDNAKPGLTRWFIISAWNDAIQKASGHSWIDDSWYHPPENIPHTSLWKLRCGGGHIGIARSKKTLKTYENWHKKLRVDYAENKLAKEIVAKYQELNDTAQEIRQRLQEFSDMECLPGHCELS